MVGLLMSICQRGDPSMQNLRAYDVFFRQRYPFVLSGFNSATGRGRLLNAGSGSSVILTSRCRRETNASGR